MGRRNFRRRLTGETQRGWMHWTEAFEASMSLCIRGKSLVRCMAEEGEGRPVTGGDIPRAESHWRQWQKLAEAVRKE